MIGFDVWNVSIVYVYLDKYVAEYYIIYVVGLPERYRFM